jgi:hypothetical protein
VITQITKQAQFFHIVWFEVLSPFRPLAPSQKDDIDAFLNDFPTSSVGSSGTWLDLLYPILILLDGLTYDATQL